MTPFSYICMLPVKAYRLIFSPWVGCNCRYNPTCSAYALEALEKIESPQAGEVIAHLFTHNPVKYYERLKRHHFETHLVSTIEYCKSLRRTMKYFAAIKYSGYSNNRKEKGYKNQLIRIIEESKLKILSDHYVLSYDAPTKFYNRRNERVNC